MVCLLLYIFNKGNGEIFSLKKWIFSQKSLLPFVVRLFRQRQRKKKKKKKKKKNGFPPARVATKSPERRLRLERPLGVRTTRLREHG